MHMGHGAFQSIRTCGIVADIELALGGRTNAYRPLIEHDIVRVATLEPVYRNGVGLLRVCTAMECQTDVFPSIVYIKRCSGR